MNSESSEYESLLFSALAFHVILWLRNEVGLISIALEFLGLATESIEHSGLVENVKDCAKARKHKEDDTNDHEDSPAWALNALEVEVVAVPCKEDAVTQLQICFCQRSGNHVDPANGDVVVHFLRVKQPRRRFALVLVELLVGQVGICVFSADLLHYLVVSVSKEILVLT